MALLASAGEVVKNEESRDESSAQLLVKVLMMYPKFATSIRPDHLSLDCQEQPEGLEYSKDAEHKQKSVGEEEKEKLNDVDYLTGNPLPSDILLYAVPVCGPYNALQAYKYRVKITPGTMKKGKAALNLFGHMPEATNREKELMKACTDPELVAAIVGNVKIIAAGLLS
ncbi:Nuclear export mediator factor nemf [Thalictrum thalictroides]|uniref:Nuclear export mediator factor nemf n=1 Tax=Thalictrum thalictroides TaxID=46969 RepID=A0A7J6WPT5_THATH|nr:Nuclear export mediator factor nemf [Thalictrum thalictroides]